MKTLELAEHGPVIPVIVLQRLEDAVPLAEALVAGGVKVLEITLRTSIALKCIEAIASAVPDAIVGAGTVRNAVRCARRAECRLPLRGQPGLYQRGRQGLPRPGPAAAARRRDLQRSHAWPMPTGWNSSNSSRPPRPAASPMLKAWAGPFPDVAFCPTGGITVQTAPQFLALPNVRVCGGSWLTPPELVAAGDWKAITALAREAGQLRLRPDGPRSARARRPVASGPALATGRSCRHATDGLRCRGR